MRRGRGANEYRDRDESGLLRLGAGVEPFSDGQPGGCSCFSPEPVQWLWPGRFALGKLSLIAGEPGLGKSFLTLDMAARSRALFARHHHEPPSGTPASQICATQVRGTRRWYNTQEHHRHDAHRERLANA